MPGFPVDAAVSGGHETSVCPDRQPIVSIEKDNVQNRRLHQWITGIYPGLAMLDEPRLAGIRAGEDGCIVSHRPQATSELRDPGQCGLHRHRSGLAPFPSVFRQKHMAARADGDESFVGANDVQEQALVGQAGMNGRLGFNIALRLRLQHGRQRHDRRQHEQRPNPERHGHSLHQSTPYYRSNTDRPANWGRSIAGTLAFAPPLSDVRDCAVPAACSCSGQALRRTN